MPRGLCALRTLVACVPPTTSYSCASSALERTGSKRIETTIRKRQLGFAGALFRRGDSRLSKRVMFGRLAVQGPKRGGRPTTHSWGDCLQKKTPGLRGDPVQRKANDKDSSHSEFLSRDIQSWMTAAKNVGIWHRGVEKGAETLENAWRRARLRQSNVRRQRGVSEIRAPSRASANSESVTICMYVCVYGHHI